MIRNRIMYLALAAALLGVPGPSRAGQTSYDVERLSLDPSARGSLVLGDGETLPAGGYRLALGVGYEKNPLVVREQGLRGGGLGADGHRVGTLVEDRFTLHLTGAVAVTERLEIGLRVPFTLSQQGDDLAGYPSLRGNGVGPFSVMARYGLLRQASGAPVSVAVAAEVFAPINRSGDLDGDPSPMLVPRLEAGRRFESFLVGADLGATLRRHTLKLPGGEELDHELNAGLVAATTGWPLRLEASLRGAFNHDGLGPSAELLGGVRYGFKYAELFALAGPGFGNGPGTPAFRGLVGVALTPGEAPAAPAPVAAEPAPAPAPDPCAAGQAHTPEQCPALDDDGDGIRNGDDRCPTQPGIAELQGCPAVDSDGDGVPDHLDKCPKVKGLAEYQGCLPPDRDGDGIADPDDKCPDQPGIAELQGCPPARAEIKAGKIDIKEKVFFDTGKAVVQPRSYALLDDVAKLIAGNPQVGKIRIEGHTDDRGAAALNRKLSQGRAEAVRDYLVGKGVPAERLSAQGFGPDQPAASNKTAAGREANRRVEFSILGLPQ